jgi:RNA polymerase sigma factor (sigma-70 family)
MDPVLKLRLIPYNLRLVGARKELGLSQKDVALLSGIHVQRIGHIETLRVLPTQEEMEELAGALNQPAEYLFPAALYDALADGAFKKREEVLTSEKVAFLVAENQLLLSAPFEEIEKEAPALSGKIVTVLRSIKPKERAVIERRFGLDGGESRTLREAGEELEVTPERIRQIEVKALRHLRQPSRSRPLAPFLFEGADTHSKKGKKKKQRRFLYADPVKIEQLPLSPFLQACLKAAGFQTVGQLRGSLTEEKLSSLPQISKWSADKIWEVIHTVTD